jgi:hypothetical protein
MTNHEQDDWGDDGGLRPQLGAYADARLRADPEARARSRANVMAEARAASDAARMDATAPAARLAASPAQALPRHRSVFGRFRVPAAVAATLLLVGALTVGAALAGSGPGGPFYAARLWVEGLTLPTDADARAEAQVARLEARLAEAAAAAEAGNGAAVTAALEAYRATVEAALGDAGLDPTRREHLAAELGRHVVVLQALVPLVPDRASKAIQAAVDRTEERIQEILATPPGVTPGKPETPPGKPAATPKLPATPKPTPAGPSKTPPGKPEATPKQPATPKPTPAGPSKTPPGKPETPPGKQTATPAP